jgi:hypothetical protein
MLLLLTAFASVRRRSRGLVYYWCRAQFRFESTKQLQLQFCAVLSARVIAMRYARVARDSTVGNPQARWSGLRRDRALQLEQGVGPVYARLLQLLS